MIVSVTTEIVVGTACLAAAGPAGAAVANAMNPNADHSTLGVLKDIGVGALWGAAGGAAGAAAAPVVAAIGKALGKGVGQLISKGGAGAACPIGNSFTSGTLVLMADGSTKPIEKLEPGDKVLATDPETGETVTKDVTATILGDGAKNLVEVTIGNGEADSASEVITTTDKHPFWVVDLAEWVDATDLKPGQWLRTSAGTHVQVSAVKRHTAQQATVHNLTVADLHTYYVLAGATSVLVHNCNAPIAAQLKARVDQLHGLLAKGAQGRRSTAIVRAVDSDGAVHDVVGWSGDAARGLDRRIREGLQAGEVMADKFNGDAEMTALNYIQNQGWTPLAGAANRPVCPWCQNTLFDPFSSSVGPARLVGPSDRTAIGNIRSGQIGGRLMGQSQFVWD